MEFLVLGPLEIRRAGAEIPVGAGKLRALLGALLLDAGNVVSTDRLIDVMWPARTPASAGYSLHNHVMRLRRILADTGPDRIRTVAPGYLIHLEPGELDLRTFTDLCADGRAAAREGRWTAARADLAGALALWRGTPLAGIPGMDGRHPLIANLEELRLQALDGRIEADLHLGRAAEVIAELRTLTADHPLRESLHGHLMLALYRENRQAEAQEVYRDLRSTLVGQLGVEPSAPIEELHRGVLRGDPGLRAVSGPDPVGPLPLPLPLPLAPLMPTPTPTDPEPGGPARASRVGAGPRFQLPPDTRAFTGRTAELDELTALALDVAGSGGGRTDSSGNSNASSGAAIVIAAINGMAGIGKTALAVHTAHRLRADFPDGQLFLDLHGHTPGLAPLTAEEALDQLLRSLGAPPEEIPRSLDERSGLYRHIIAGTRTLIVLDNAAGAAQVRPLLPGAPGCLVLITSRRRLVGLDDAYTLAIDTLPTAVAAELLHKVAGPDRMPLDHPGIGELVDLCGRLPLAVRIAAARLRHHHALRFEDVIEELRDEGARLDHLRDEDRDLTAVFASSYATLPEAEKHMFRHLGLFPGPSFDAYAAANLADVGLRTARRLLLSLADHNLVTEDGSGRYRLHDLLRAYARAVVDEHEPASSRDQAITRVLCYYESTAVRANALFTPARQRPAAAQGGAPARETPALTGPADAANWLVGERGNLLAAIRLVEDRADHGEGQGQGAALGIAVAAYLRKDENTGLAKEVSRIAVAAARRSGSRRLEADALLGAAAVNIGTQDERIRLADYTAVLDIYREIGDDQGEADTLRRMSFTTVSMGDFAAAVGYAQAALAIFERIDDRFGQADTLRALGRVWQTTGQYGSALEARDRALAIFREVGDLEGEATVLLDHGRLLELTGNYPAAVEVFERVLAIPRRVRGYETEALMLWRLGRIRRVTRPLAESVRTLEQAAAVLRDSKHQNGNVAHVLCDLGHARRLGGEYAEAAALAEEALAIFRARGNRHGGANALQELGRVRHATGDHAAAADLLGEALRGFAEVGDRHGEAEVHNSLGDLAADTSGPAEARAQYEQGLELARATSSPVEEARALRGIAHCADRLGDPDAPARLTAAVEIYRRIGAVAAEEAADELARWLARPGMVRGGAE